MSAAEIPEGAHEDVYVFLGRRRAKAGKVAYVYAPLSDLTATRWYSKALSPAPVIGGQYSVWLDESHAVYGGRFGPSYRGPLTDAELLVEWRAADSDARLVQVARSKQASDAREVLAMGGVLDTIRNASRNLTREQRRALAVELMQAVGL